MVANGHIFLLQTRSQDIGQTMNAIGNAFQANRAMIDRIQAGNIRQQDLRSTDIGVRFLAADVLLTRLHRHTQCSIARGIARNPNNTPRHGALKLITTAKKCRVWTTVAHGHAKTLRRTKHNVSP